MQTHESAKTGHELGHYHLGRLRRLLWVVDGRRHSPGSHLLRQERTVAPPQLLVYLTSSAGSRIQSSVWMSSMMSTQDRLRLTTSQDRVGPATHSSRRRRLTTSGQRETNRRGVLRALLKHAKTQYEDTVRGARLNRERRRRRRVKGRAVEKETAPRRAD